MTVYLVGAGPGDPGLITVRGADLIARADVIIYDRLSAPSLLDLAPPGAERVYVGKGPGRPSTPQTGINRMLIDLGGRGGTIVRLKGGDPFVFARGGEEAEALRAAGVPYEVVPGITSAIAAPAYGGIPLTKRYSSTSFTVVTGHEEPGKATSPVDWRAIARVGGTIVILMGIRNLPTITSELIAGGLEPTTPAAAIRWGSRPSQVTTHSSLGEISGLALEAPSVIVVGEVAAENLDWFESRALFGTSVVVTRAAAQSSRLSRRLEELGASIVSFPTIVISDAPDAGRHLRECVARLHEFEWVVLGSPNAASRFLAAVGDVRRMGRTRIAVIGPGTAEEVRAHSMEPDVVPDRYVAEGLLEVFPEPGPSEVSRVLLPRAEATRDVLAPGLRAAGWDVTESIAYRTVPASPDDDLIAEVREADVVAFASSSAARNFAAAVPRDAWPSRCAAIGPVTASTARDLGFDSVQEADQNTIGGLVDGVVRLVRRDP